MSELDDLAGILSGAPEMRAFFDLVGRVARSEATVLIRGETGSGKELVARAIHRLSRRRDGPFLAVSCATFTAELLASELFGHVRGAFTGAIKDRQGLFELADGGTLFLDEVAETPLDVQARLLRVLQERAFVPLGASEPRSAEVRILAATHRSLRHEVHARRFREDLMYRIRVIPLFVPRLADRTGDVRRLALHFIERLNARESASAARGDPAAPRRLLGISAAALGALEAHDWPGNVRELMNVIEYAFVVGEGDTLEYAHLPPELRGELAGEARGERNTREGGWGRLRWTGIREAPLGATDDHGPDLRARERRRILEALDAAGGHRGKAASALEMSRTTLWRKLKEHRLVE